VDFAVTQGAQATLFPEGIVESISVTQAVTAYHERQRLTVE
jgi:hypothetical protein